MDLPSRLDYYAIGRDYVIQRAKKIDPTIVDVEGSDANIFVGGGSVLCDAVTRQLGQAINNLLLDGANEDDLDRYALDRYNLPRKGASPAVTTVRMFRPTAAGGTGSVAGGTKMRTAASIEYVTLADAPFPVGALSSMVDARAVQAGKVTQVGANAIRTFSSPGSLFDQTIQVTNDDPTAGGEDVEDDDTFRSRIRSFWTTARRGVLGAIELGAKSVSGVVSAQAVEALAVGGLPGRVVNLYIADSSGVANRALAKQVVLALDDYRAAGVAVLVSTSIPLIVGVQLHLAFAANVDTDALTATIRAAIVEFVNSLPVNGTLYLAQLQSVLARYTSSGLIPNSSSVSTPAGDLVPLVGQTLRTTLAQVIAA